MELHSHLLQVGYLIVEHEECPELLQDKYWDCSIPDSIPYTVAAEKYKKEEFIGSAEQTLNIKESDKVYSDVYKVYGSGTGKLGAVGKSEPVESAYDLEYGDYEDIGTPVPVKATVKNCTAPPKAKPKF